MALESGKQQRVRRSRALIFLKEEEAQNVYFFPQTKSRSHLSTRVNEQIPMADKDESLAAAVNLLTLLASDSGKETFFLPTHDDTSTTTKQKCFLFECSSTALQALSKMFLPSTPGALKVSALKSIAKKAKQVELTETQASFNTLFGYGIS